MLGSVERDLARRALDTARSRGATYSEYDVYPRAKGAHRDAFRIVVNRKTKMTWFSPNHYTDFYKL